MRREQRVPRVDWPAKVEELGFSWHSMDGVYWDERACYRLTSDEVDTLEAATGELHQRCLEAVEHVIAHRRYAELGIAPAFAPLIERSWRDRAPSLYGRMDLAFGDGVPRLLEYNADTPTALLEASVVQWYWLQEVMPQADQFNSIHEKLIAKWKDLKDYVADPVYFAYLDNDEDTMTVTYLLDTAEQAGLRTQAIQMGDIGWDQEKWSNHIQLWDVATGRPGARIDSPPAKDPPTPAALSPDGKVVAAAGHQDGTVRLWDAPRPGE